MLGGHQTARPGADDRHTRIGSQPHAATLSDQARLGSRAGSQRLEAADRANPDRAA
jgi:hypothetical protein